MFEAIADELMAANVRHVSGVIGEDTAPLVQGLLDRGVPYRGARHENIAVNMADGAAWLGRGDVAVCVLTRGPGMTNGATALTTAARYGARVLVITGDGLPDASVGPDLKRMDQAALARHLGLAHVAISEVGQVEAATRAAIELARAGHTTHLAVPLTVQLQLAAPAGNRVDAQTFGSRDARRPAQGELERAVRLLATSRRPLVLAGHGAWLSGARMEIVELAERWGALLGTTLKAKDMFRGHEMDFGLVGGFTPPGRRALLQEVDCVLALGAQLTSYTTANGSLLRHATIVQCDVDSTVFGRHHDIDAGVTADVATLVEDLHAHLPLQSADSEIGFHGQRARTLLGATATPPLPNGFPVSTASEEIDPRELVALLDGLLPPDRRVVCDGGHFVGFPAMYMRVADPDRFRFTLDFAAVGMGLGTALGAATAAPDVPTVLFIGDGGLTMTLGDLETVADSRPALTIVVMNDRAYGAERHLMDTLELPHGQSLLSDVDFARVAGSLGIQSFRIRSLADLEAVSDTLASGRDGPLLLDCLIRPDVRGQWMDH